MAQVASLPTFSHIQAPNPNQGGRHSFGSCNSWGILTAQFSCCTVGGGVKRGGLGGEERLANLFSAAAVVQVAMQQISG